MNPTESLALTRFVRAACPQQKFDEYTPDAWHELMRDLAFADCRAAVVELGRRQPFISPAEIRAEVKRIRTARLQAAGTMADPEYDPDDVAAGLAAIRAARRAVADGTAQPAVVAPNREGQARVQRALMAAASRMPTVEVPK